MVVVVVAEAVVVVEVVAAEEDHLVVVEEEAGDSKVDVVALSATTTAITEGRKHVKMCMMKNSVEEVEVACLPQSY